MCDLALHFPSVSVPDHCPRFAPSCQFSSKLQPNSFLTQACREDPCLLGHLHSHRRSNMDSRTAVHITRSRDTVHGPSCRHPLLPHCGFLRAWDLHGAVLLSSRAPLPQHARRNFTLNPVRHCLKYALWIRCYIFSLLISLSSFNCSLEASSTLVTGIILPFLLRVQLALLFTGISQGLNLFLNFSWDTKSHVPQIIPPSIPLLLFESSQKRKKQPAYFSLRSTAY